MSEGADATRSAIDAVLAAAAAFGVPAFDAESLVRYVEAVVDENDRINLTGAKSLAVAVEILAIDSLPVATGWGRKAPPTRIVDLGTGNGLPGVAAALFWRDAEAFLVERRAKKAHAVERCLARAGLERVRVIVCDGRELLRARPELERRVDLVTVRAVGDLASTTKEACEWLASEGRIVHWKAHALDPTERAAGDEGARAHRLRPLPDVEFALPSGAKRRLVIYERP